RRSVSCGIVVLALVRPDAWAERGSRVHAQSDQPASLVGAWTLNKDLSDAPQDRSSEGRDEAGAGDGGGGRGRRGGGRGGFGRGGDGFGRGAGNTGVRADPDQTARMRDAMRDIMNPP